MRVKQPLPNPPPTPPQPLPNPSPPPPLTEAAQNAECPPISNAHRSGAKRNCPPHFDRHLSEAAQNAIVAQGHAAHATPGARGRRATIPRAARLFILIR